MARLSAAARDAKWDKGDLQRRICRVLDIAKIAVARLARNGYTDSEAPENSLRPEKLISETGVLLYAASVAARDPRCAIAIRLNDVAQLLIPHARSERIMMGVCLEPSLAFDFAEAHVCLSNIGYRDFRFDELLRQAVASQAASGRERVPHRMLQQSWIYDIWTGSAGRDGKREPVGAVDSVLNSPLDLFGGGRGHAYAFTHALMYVSGFNARDSRLPRVRSVILAEAEAALARSLDEEDYDLAGELLMAWPLTGKSWSAAAAFGFRVLARVEDIGGILPAPSTLQLRLDKLHGDERTDYFLATAYHTAYVMGLLCSAAQRSGRSPPAQVTVCDAGDRRSGRILDILDADGRSPHWRIEFDQLSTGERDALAGFLLTIALCRRAKQHTYGVIRELLEVGYSLGLTNAPAASQAAEMLQRLATFADIDRSITCRRSATN
jgi:hypothetical protein